MKIEIAEHGRMTESGSSLLRLIQNQSIPLLDLFVREAVQNALDAALPRSKTVDVDIRVGEFKSASLNKHFEKIERALNQRFPQQTCKYILIRDTNTHGLEGPVRYSEVKNNNFGNLLKLVYEICKPQQNQGAGGSWGLGKTIYFRMGIGLVIYYSRIKQNGVYSSRLAACLVENETKKTAMIPMTRGVRRGIAWWGKEDETSTERATVPIDNEEEIETILSVFGVKRYTGAETGTTVIIPYIDEKSLLNEVYAKNESETDKPYWVKSLSDYLKIAVQRWYAPRINNRNYRYGAYLSACINGSRINVSNMLSLFRIVRELYILATGCELDSESLIRSGNVEYTVDAINLRGVLENTTSGYLAHAKFNDSQLDLAAPDNGKTPFQQISNIYVSMEGENSPIIMYTRKIGMIVGYDVDGQWTHRMPKTKENEYIIGLFVANSENTLKNIKDPGNPDSNLSLEEYIRQGERADHASWSDRNIDGNNPRIITNIQKNVIKRIKAKYTETTPDNTVKTPSGLSTALATLLLPGQDFGRKPTVPKGGGGGGGQGHKHRKSSYLKIIGQPKFFRDYLELSFEMFLKKQEYEIALQVITEFKNIEANDWESEVSIGKVFPIDIKELNVTGVQIIENNIKKKYSCSFKINENRVKGSLEFFTAGIVFSERFNSKSYIHIKSLKDNCYITGTVALKFADRGVKGDIVLREKKYEYSI